jgi:hypothetical protein
MNKKSEIFHASPRRRLQYSRYRGRFFLLPLIATCAGRRICWSKLANNPNIVMSNIKTDQRFHKILKKIAKYDLRLYTHYFSDAKIMSHQYQYVNIRHILREPNRKWNWKIISRCPNITMEDVIAHPELPWDWKALSANPNITLEFIMNNFDKIDIAVVCTNNLYFDGVVHARESRKSILTRRASIDKALAPVMPKEMANVILRYIDFA